MQVREYANITTDASSISSLDCGVVSEATFDWLQELVAGWKGAIPIALINGRRSIKWGSYVGYLQSPTGETIEILPKTSLGIESPENTRNILQRMLSCALGIKPRQIGPADLRRIKTPLHEWIFNQFLQELKVLIARGLRFDYESIEEESRFVKGQLMLDRQQRQPPGREHIFNIRHDIFSPNRIENRLLRTALECVRCLCKESENWRLANEISHLMADISTVKNPLQEIQHWETNKLTQSYDAIKPWCVLILEQLNPNFQKGIHKGVSLLFPMERLFEIYVEACLRERFRLGTRLKAQAKSKFLVAHKPTESVEIQNWFQLRPDLILYSQAGQQVMDAKWKLINQYSTKSNEKYGIKQGDLYQLFAYGHKYQKGSGHTMLIYPKHETFTQSLPAFNFAENFVLWAVPFCLESRSLVSGEWMNFFPALDNSIIEDA